MANPQLEDGHIKIANEIVDHFAMLKLSAYEWQVLWAIMRKTYGWNRKTDFISLTQFEKLTNIPAHHVAHTLSKLVNKNMIIKHNTSKVMEYGLQKDYTKWTELNKTIPLPIEVLPNQVLHEQVLPKQVLHEQVLHETPTGSTQIGTASVPTGSTQTGTNKRHIKDNIQKTYIQPLLGEFKNIQLTQEEYDKLVVRFGETITKDKIEELSIGIESKGYKCKSHYATILSWDRLKEKRNKPLIKPESPIKKYQYFQAPPDSEVKDE